MSSGAISRSSRRVKRAYPASRATGRRRPSTGWRKSGRLCRRSSTAPAAWRSEMWTLAGTFSSGRRSNRGTEQAKAVAAACCSAMVRGGAGSSKKWLRAANTGSKASSSRARRNSSGRTASSATRAPAGCSLSTAADANSSRHTAPSTATTRPQAGVNGACQGSGARAQSAPCRLKETGSFLVHSVFKNRACSGLSAGGAKGGAVVINAKISSWC